MNLLIPILAVSIMWWLIYRWEKLATRDKKRNSYPSAKRNYPPVYKLDETEIKISE